MAGLFKKDKEGRNCLSRTFSETVNMAGIYKECFGDEFVDLAKGRESDFCGLNGAKRGHRILGLMLAPLILPAATAVAPIVIPTVGTCEGIDKHRHAEEQKPPQNKYDQM
ncbi:MAG: hypothetical protein CL561_05510 [Alphaproteobacteria bacterium]|nr:hypothetical protein [Alphaproteobacteria bacterium]|tara:strand:- start:4204 stop:4533 length:330 start_codon:yes stop_codon:yes gene_type:complete